MRKLRKVMALLLTLAMVMGLSVTAFAAKSATITVTGITKNTKLSILQVIAPDQTTETGWTFVNGAEKAYTDALKVDDGQKAIWMLIKAKNPQANVPAGIEAATAAEISQALTNIGNTGTFKDFSNGGTVNSAGVYAIKANDGLNIMRYTNMSAYVGFDEVDGVYPVLNDVALQAKGSSIIIEKENNDDDGIVSFGDIVTYTVEGVMPYFNANATEKTYEIWDEISGAAYYKLEGEGATAKVFLGGQDITSKVKFEISESTDEYGRKYNKFVVKFDQFIDDNNTNGGKKIVITYDAKVDGTATEIGNKASSHINGEESDYIWNYLETGSIKLTKFNEDSTEKLAGAGFEVTKNGAEEVLKFTKVADGIYKYNPDGDVTEIFTAEKDLTYGDVTFLEKCELIIYGLDLGKYHFTETTAPEGYSINQDGADAELKIENDSAGKALVYIPYDETSMTDTKLAELPGTGGIGTTIFTIGGCVIMIAAAGLYFASRRKHGEN